MLPTDRVCARVAPTRLRHWCAQDNGPHWKRTSSPTSMSRRMIIQMCSTYTVPCDAVRAAPIGARCTALRCVGTAQRDCKCEAQSCHIWLRVTYNHPLSLPPPTRPPQTPWPPGRGPSSLVPKHTTVQQVAHHPSPNPQTHLGAHGRRSLTPTHSHLQVDLCVVDFGQVERCRIKTDSENGRERAVQAKRGKP